MNIEISKQINIGSTTVPYTGTTTVTQPHVPLSARLFFPSRSQNSSTRNKSPVRPVARSVQAKSLEGSFRDDSS